MELTLAPDTPMTEGGAYHLAVNGIFDWALNVIDRNFSETSFVAEGFLPDSGPPKLRVVAFPPFWTGVDVKRRLFFDWTGGGVLQGAFDLDGNWEDVSGIANPYVLDLAGETCSPPPRFFRVKS